MGQEVSFNRRHRQFLGKKRSVVDRIILIIGVLCYPDRLSPSLLTHAHLARSAQVKDDEHIKIETLRLATEQKASPAVRKLTQVRQPSSWLACSSGVYAYAAYPIRPGPKTIQGAIMICEMTNSATISGKDLIILNLLLDSAVNTTFWKEENTTVKVESYLSAKIIGARGTWFGFGKRTCPGLSVSTYAQERGYFCGRSVKEEQQDESLVSAMPPIKNSPRTETHQVQPAVRLKDNGSIRKTQGKRNQTARKRRSTGRNAAKILLSLREG
ncbi:hypothetical protein NCS52_01518600 [Fusarium sp. LHS14.1]|nr:hypothetical protein NCS52_01518600 [Fusarium sp. LHS14.1]